MPDNSRRAELAKIHIARKDLALTDDVYEAMVLRASGGRATSAGDLDSAGRGRLIGALVALGWRPKSKAGARAAADAQSRMIRGLWIALADAGKVRDKAEKALRAWVEKQTGKSDLRFCDGAEKRRLIEALKAWKAREGAA